MSKSRPKAPGVGALLATIGANGQTFTTPLQSTDQVYTGEMCNLFGMYAPTTGSSWSALGLTQTVVSSP